MTRPFYTSGITCPDCGSRHWDVRRSTAECCCCGNVLLLRTAPDAIPKDRTHERL